MKSSEKLPFRIGVGIVLLNKKNEVFVGERIDNPGKYFQLPQGGVDENESFFQAAIRELKEETGVQSIELLKEINGWLEYDLPEYLLGKIWNGKYRGQKQKWFIVKFTGEEEEIDIKTKSPEFTKWKWIKYKELPKVVVDFKLEIYKKLVNEIDSIKLN